MSTQVIQPSRAFQTAPGRAVTQDTPWRRLGLAIWRGLERVGRARARSELRRLAVERDGVDPELAARLRQAARHLD